MEYQFIRGLTGEYRVKCSMGHEIIGRWLEEELYTDEALIESMLSAMRQVKSGSGEEFSFQGKEISIFLSHDEVAVQENAFDLSEELLDSEFNFYNSESYADCGLEDFEQLLLSWIAFIRS